MRAVAGLEKELGRAQSFRLNITIDHDSIGKGQDHAEIRESLRNWLTVVPPGLSDGHHEFENIPGVPFALHLEKSSERRAGLFFARRKPEDLTLARRLRELLDRKVRKLAPYRSQGLTTVLLVENRDIALMNDRKMLSALRSAYPVSVPAGVDQLWYADTSIEAAIEFREFTSDLGRFA